MKIDLIYTLVILVIVTRKPQTSKGSTRSQPNCILHVILPTYIPTFQIQFISNI